MEPTENSRKADHLCVLVHGLWGNPSHLKRVAQALRDKHPVDELHILVAKRNSGNFTYDGIELGGERVCHEIEDEIAVLAKKGQEITKLSLVGYSLGGLIARYAIGLLYSRGVFDKVEPINLTTFASPHLGVRTPAKGWFNDVWNILGSRTLSMSGQQLFLIDNFRDTGRPLLAVLADPESTFIKGLAKFKRRTLYTNIINDRSAPYYTTCITKTDPYTDLDKVKINYLPGTEDVLIDIRRPVSPIGPPDVSPYWYNRVLADGQSVAGRLPLMMAFTLFIPIGAVVFLLNAGVQTFNSSRRIKLHETGQAGIQIDSYRTPLLLDGVRGAVDDAFESLNRVQSQEYLEDPDEEAVAADTIETGAHSDSPDDEKSSESRGLTKKDLIKRNGSSRMSVQILALTQSQFDMIDALDRTGWRKFPVHIQKVRHSHAAIIVRRNVASMSEGYIVMKHWVDNEFLMS